MQMENNKVYKTANEATAGMIHDPKQWAVGFVCPMKHRNKTDETGWPLLGLIFAHELNTVRIGNMIDAIMHKKMGLSDIEIAEGYEGWNYTSKSHLMENWIID